MKKVARASLLAGGFVALLACATPVAHAQQRDPNQPRPTPTPYEPKTGTRMVVTPRAGKQNKAETPSLPSNTLRRVLSRQLKPARIFGSIRWKKELGLPYAFNDDWSQSEETCAKAFFVLAETDPPSETGVYGSERGKKAHETSDGYYVCRYLIPNREAGTVPFNRPLVVTASIEYQRLDDNEIPGVTKGMTWSGANQPLPPGYVYRIIDNPRRLTITEEQPEVTVDFEIRMVPLSPVHPPAFQRPAPTGRRRIP